jgi:hypothetical protein
MKAATCEYTVRKTGPETFQHRITQAEIINASDTHATPPPSTPCRTG